MTFVHCDLIDKEKNLFNGKWSDLLAWFDITGKPFEKISYRVSAKGYVWLLYRQTYK